MKIFCALFHLIADMYVYLKLGITLSLDKSYDTFNG